MVKFLILKELYSSEKQRIWDFLKSFHTSSNFSFIYAIVNEVYDSNQISLLDLIDKMKQQLWGDSSDYRIQYFVVNKKGLRNFMGPVGCDWLSQRYRICMNSGTQRVQSFLFCIKCDSDEE